MKSLILKFFRGHERSVKAKKNIIASFLIKGVSVIIGFLLIPITLEYLDEVKYGIWVTLTAFLTWFTFFEIGLGNGMKNKLAESLANKEYTKGRIYVSTTYAIIAIVVMILAVIFIIGNFFIDWTVILNTPSSMAKELSQVALIVFGFFFIRFTIKLIGNVLEADQRPAISNAMGPIGNLITLIVVYILTKTTESSLIYLAWALSVIPIVVLLVASIYFYSTDYKKIAPSIHYVNFKYAKDLLSLGVKFFIIQISGLIMFQSSNFVIAQFFGPEEVTAYNIAHKLFSAITMIFTIVISPFWPAFTEAWVKDDVLWIKNTVRKLLFFWVGLVVLGLIILLVSSNFFDFWIGKEKMEKIDISIVLKVSLLIHFLIISFGGIFNMFVNGVGKLAMQMQSVIVGAILFFPLCIFFIKYLNWGIESVVIATIISNFYLPIFAPIQYHKLINKKATGIWNN